MPGYVTAFEHQRIPISSATENGITPSEADHLLEIGATRSGFARREQHHVSLAQYCGVVGMGDRVLEILPKVAESQPAESSREILLRLLGLSGAFPQLRQQPTGQGLLRAPLIEFFIAAFFDEIVMLVKGGLLQKYILHHDNIGFVRGRIHYQTQFGSNANRRDRVSCIYDELTVDNEWNQIISAGLTLVRPWLQSTQMIRRWNELQVVFQDIPQIPDLSASVRHLVYERAASRYRPAMDWIKWIASTLSPASHAGSSRAPGLIVDMNMLFERALGSVLRERSPYVTLQDSTRFLAKRRSSGKGVYRLRPDYLFRKNGKVFAIADAKWKRLKTNEQGFLVPPASDINQMQAYSIAYECSHMALIYPWHAGLKHSRETSFSLARSTGTGTTVDVLCVDVDDDQFPMVRGDASGLIGRLFEQQQFGPDQASA